MASATRWRRPTLSQVTTLALGVFLVPLRVWATNLYRMGVPEQLLAWAVLMWLIAIALWILLVSRGANPGSVTYTLFWVMLTVGGLGSLAGSDSLRTVVLWGIVAAVGVLTYRLGSMGAYLWLTRWAIVVAVVLPLGLAMQRVLARGQSEIPAASPVVAATFEETPDVVILVFDGMASPRVLEDLYGYEGDDFERLRALGLGIATTMHSNYPFTHLSIPSFFRMDYPLKAGGKVGDAEWVDLRATAQGENPLVDGFKSQGYKLLVVEPGWHAVDCQGVAGDCVPGGWPSPAAQIVVQRSLLRSVIPTRYQESAPIRTIRSIAWLRSELDGYLDNGTAELIVVHLLLPHPPLRLDTRCEFRADGGQGGIGLPPPPNNPGKASERKLLYLDQARCALAVLEDVAARVGDDAVLIAFSDHGPDSRAQLSRPASTWTGEDVAERLEIFFATNADCGLTEAGSLVNVGRTLLACLAGQPAANIESRYFIDTYRHDPLIEIDVGELSGG